MAIRGGRSTRLSVGSESPSAVSLEMLRQQIAQLETSRRSEQTVVSTGCPGLDRRLPRGGLPRGTLVEWLAAQSGSGAETLSLFSAREAIRQGGPLVVLDRSRDFCPPAAVRLGIAAPLLIVVQPGKSADMLWALDQSLRCPGVGAVLAWLEKIDSRTFRRLQLAAEQGGGLGLLLRPAAARHEPSWAEIRFGIEPRPSKSPRRRMRIELLRVRGGKEGEIFDVEIDDETHTLHLAPRVEPRRQIRGA